MQFNLLFILFLFLSISVNASTITPESTTEISLSNKDINRLVCTNGLINDVYYSKEKGLTVTTDKDSVYIKYLIQDNGVSKRYVVERTEFFVICDGETYTLISTPRSDIQTQTYRLGNPYKSRVENNNRVFKGIPDEEKAIMITKMVYKNDTKDLTPDEKRLFEKVWRTDVIPNSEVTLHRTFRLDGHGLSIKEYRLRSLVSNLDLQETQFLNTFFGSNIFSISVIPQRLNINQFAQIFIVERGASND